MVLGIGFSILTVAILAFMYMLFCDLVRDQKQRDERHSRFRDKLYKDDDDSI